MIVDITTAALIYTGSAALFGAAWYYLKKG